MYEAIFSRQARKAFMALSDPEARRVRAAILELAQNPRGRGTLKLEHAPVAEYRRRVGNLRILFDIDDSAQRLEILDIRMRNERTYR